LQALLLRHRPAIVHFSGHGSADGELVLEDDAGCKDTVTTGALGNLFAILKKDIQCVVLNACYSETQAQAIAAHVGCVVGLRSDVGDKAAIAFASKFYQALGFGEDFGTAFALGCIEVELENLDAGVTFALFPSCGDPGRLILPA
jgi:hypothetical protein